MELLYDSALFIIIFIIIIIFKVTVFQIEISDMKFKYKEERSLAQRMTDGEKVRLRYPDRVPGMAPYIN